MSTIKASPQPLRALQTARVTNKPPAAKPSTPSQPIPKPPEINPSDGVYANQVTGSKDEENSVNSAIDKGSIDAELLQDYDQTLEGLLDGSISRSDLKDFKELLFQIESASPLDRTKLLRKLSTDLQKINAQQGNNRSFKSLIKNLKKQHTEIYEKVKSFGFVENDLSFNAPSKVNKTSKASSTQRTQTSSNTTTPAPISQNKQIPLAQRIKASPYQAFISLQPAETTPKNFENLKSALTAYNKISPNKRPDIPLDTLARLETVFMRKAMQQEGAEQQITLKMLPSTFPNSLALQKARGSLGMLAIARESSEDISKLPPAIKQNFTNQLNAFLKMSGSTLDIQTLNETNLVNAIKELESKMGMDITGDLSIENLRDIERAQTKQFTMITSAQNILHDEIISFDPRKSKRGGETNYRAAVLKSLVGEGKTINHEESLKHIEVLRDNLKPYINQNLTLDRSNLDNVYKDTLIGRKRFLQEKMHTMQTNNLLTQFDIRGLSKLYQKIGNSKTFKEAAAKFPFGFKPKPIITFRQFQDIAYGHGGDYTVSQRATARKLVENPRVFDYIHSVNQGDKDRDGKVDRQHGPMVTSSKALSFSDLRDFMQKVIPLDPVSVKVGTRATMGADLTTFNDSRWAAAAIWDATKVSGDQWFAFAGLGLGTNEQEVRRVLKTSSKARSTLRALKRDFQLMYGQPIEKVLKSELGGGDLGEALTFTASKGLDVVAKQQIRTPKNAKILLAKLRPEIDIIGAENGALAWASGHSTEDKRRLSELNGKYKIAQNTLRKYDRLMLKLNAQNSEPSNSQKEEWEQTRQKLLNVTAEILLLVQADKQADVYYEQARDQAIDITKKVAVVAAATVATVATGGTGAPAMAAALAYATASAVVVGVGGEAIDQVFEYMEDKEESELAELANLKKQRNINQLEGIDQESKQSELKQLKAENEQILENRSKLKVLHSDKLLETAYESAKTGVVTAVTTLATAGLGNLAKGSKATALFAKLGETGGNITRIALVNGLTNVTSDLANNLVSPLKLNSNGDPTEIIENMDKQIQNNDDTILGLTKRKQELQAEIDAFYNKYTDVDLSVNTGETVQTEVLKPPSKEELLAIYEKQMEVKEANLNIQELSESNDSIKKDIKKLADNAGKLLTWDKEEWAAIQNNFARNLAISFVAGAALNSIGGDKLASRLLLNTGAGAFEHVGRNAIEKYVDGNDDVQLTDGLVQNILTTIIMGEMMNAVQNKQAARAGMDASLEGKAIKDLEADPTTKSVAKNIKKALKKNGFKPEDPSTHTEAVRKLAQSDPTLHKVMSEGVQQQHYKVVGEAVTHIRENAKLLSPDGDADETVLKFLDTQEDIQGLQTERQSILDAGDSSPDTQARLLEIDLQMQQKFLESQAIQSGDITVDAEGNMIKSEAHQTLESTLTNAREKGIELDPYLTREKLNEASAKIEELEAKKETLKAKKNPDDETLAKLDSEINDAEQTLKEIIDADIMFDPKGNPIRTSELEEQQDAEEAKQHAKEDSLSLEDLVKRKVEEGASKSSEQDAPAEVAQRKQTLKQDIESNSQKLIVELNDQLQEAIKAGNSRLKRKLQLDLKQATLENEVALQKIDDLSRSQKVSPELKIKFMEEVEARVKNDDPSQTQLDVLNDVLKTNPEYLPLQVEVFRDKSLVDFPTDIDYQRTLDAHTETSSRVQALETELSRLRDSDAAPEQIEQTTRQLKQERKALHDLSSGEVIYTTDGNKISPFEAKVQALHDQILSGVDERATKVKAELEEQLESAKAKNNTGDIKWLEGKLKGLDAETQFAKDKLQFLLNDNSVEISDGLKTRYLDELKTRLESDTRNGKTDFDIMKEIVVENRKAYTHKGDNVSLEVLQQQGELTKVTALSSIYDVLSDDAIKLVERQLDIQSKDEWRNYSKTDEGKARLAEFLTDDMIDPNKMIGGTNDVAWWTSNKDSKADNVTEFVEELALDPKYYAGGAVLKVTLTPEQVHDIGIRKPSPFDGMNFGEWIEADAHQAMGTTGGGKPEGVLTPVQLSKTNFEILTD